MTRRKPARQLSWKVAGFLQGFRLGGFSYRGSASFKQFLGRVGSLGFRAGVFGFRV